MLNSLASSLKSAITARETSCNETNLSKKSRRTKMQKKTKVPLKSRLYLIKDVLLKVMLFLRHLLSEKKVSVTGV